VRTASNGPGARSRTRIRSIADLDEDVRQSVRRIQADPFIPHKDSIRGFVYDVTDGRLREVS
jgi:carbonic anhydrase